MVHFTLFDWTRWCVVSVWLCTTKFKSFNSLLFMWVLLEHWCFSIPVKMFIPIIQKYFTVPFCGIPIILLLAAYSRVSFNMPKKVIELACHQFIVQRKLEFQIATIFCYVWDRIRSLSWLYYLFFPP